MGDSEESVEVAVRVRPFNSRERKRDSTCIIKMSGPTTTIVNPEDSEERPFTFDYSYWSHEGAKKLENGYFAPAIENSGYAGQEEVFKDLGVGVLENAWSGYNTSLFAYGQTGSGKSWSVVGYGVNKGIVPRFCEELFEGIKAKKAEGSTGGFEVQFSMLEIYNEKVRDLLNPSSSRKGLKVRQNASKGFYAHGLTVIPVNTYLDIEKRTEEGTKNRTIASTAMNATSSRAHTIVGVTFTQKLMNAAGQEIAKTSVVNLVDLAGSERADSTGATGDRLKEGAAINQSLSSLGNCIAALAEQSSGKRIRVPFRDSVLTKLLKNALGGNSKTIMIAALSPADINYSETLSTLRYADRAKQIKTKATVNEDPTEKLIRELQEENERLKELMQKSNSGQAVGKLSGATKEEDDDDDDDDDENTGLSEEEIKKRIEEELTERLEENEKAQREAEKHWEDRVKELEDEKKEKDDEEKKSKEEQANTPHFYNLNPDPMLTGMIVHLLRNETCKVGKAKADPKPDVALYGLSIQEDHAGISFREGDAYLLPCKDAKVLVNGEPINSDTMLHHQDRIMFGSNQLFVFHLPKELQQLTESGTAVQEITYQMAQEEITEEAGFEVKTKQENTSNDIDIQEMLSELVPLVEQANAMSTEMDKKVEFGVAVIPPKALGKTHGNKEVHITVKHLETGYRWLWKHLKFINRKFLMDEMYEDFTEEEESQVPEERDPFIESNNVECLIGTFEIYLKCITYQLELEETLAITDFLGEMAGTADVKLTPTDKSGKAIPEDKIQFDSPEEMIGRRVDFTVEIKGATQIPERYTDIYCEYTAFTYEDVKSKEVTDSQNAVFDHQQHMTLSDCTQEIVDCLSEEPVIVKVFGKQNSSIKEPVNSKAKKGRTTREIFAAQIMKKGFGYNQQPTNVVNKDGLRHAAENALLKRQLKNLRTKIENVKAVCKKEEEKQADVVKISDVHIAIGSAKMADLQQESAVDSNSNDKNTTLIAAEEAVAEACMDTKMAPPQLEIRSKGRSQGSGFCTLV